VKVHRRVKKDLVYKCISDVVDPFGSTICIVTSLLFNEKFAC
jgi:hypothetical protein